MTNKHLSRNRLTVESYPLEARVMLDSADDASSADVPEAQDDGQSGNRDNPRPRRQRDASSNSTEPAERAEGAAAQVVEARPAVTGQGRSSSAALGVDPIGPVQGDRIPTFFDESPTVTDVFRTGQRAFDRSGVNGDVAGYVGLVSTGDSLFATVATEEAFDFMENIVVTAETDGVDIADAGSQVREELNTDVVDPAVADGFDRAASEIGQGETVAAGRLQQISNNTTARIAEATGAASFVNNSVSRGNEGPIVLTFNPPNAGIDGGSDPASGATDRAPRNFTLREVTNELFSISDFRAGDTLSVPANVGNEGFRAQDVSAEQNAETSLAFNRDGSTFNDPDLFDSLAEEFASQEEATSVGDGSTIFGVFDGVVPLIGLADFGGGTENTVADLHTHPPRVASFLPFADDFELLTGGRPDPNASLPNPNAFDSVEIFFNSTDFGEPDIESLELTSLGALNNALNNAGDELLNDDVDEAIDEEGGGIPDSPDVVLEEDSTDERR